MKKDFIVRRSITVIEGKPHVETYSEQEFVRCKDCKFHGHDCPYYFAYKRTAPDDWFCADGVKKDA